MMTKENYDRAHNNPLVTAVPLTGLVLLFLSKDWFQKRPMMYSGGSMKYTATYFNDLDPENTGDGIDRHCGK